MRLYILAVGLRSHPPPLVVLLFSLAVVPVPRFTNRVRAKKAASKLAPAELHYFLLIMRALCVAEQSDSTFLTGGGGGL